VISFPKVTTKGGRLGNWIKNPVAKLEPRKRGQATRKNKNSYLVIFKPSNEK